MSGLPLSPEGFAADGRAAAAIASSDRAHGGHRRPAADANAFGEIVSALAGPAAATPGRPRPAPSLIVPAEPIPDDGAPAAVHRDVASAAQTVGADAARLTAPVRAGTDALARSLGALAGAEPLDVRTGPELPSREETVDGSLLEAGVTLRSTALAAARQPGDADPRFPGRPLAPLDPRPRAAGPADAARLERLSAAMRSADGLVGLGSTGADGQPAASADAATAPAPALDTIAAAPAPVAGGADALAAATAGTPSDVGFGPSSAAASTGPASTAATVAVALPGTAAASLDTGLPGSTQMPAPRFGAPATGPVVPSPRGVAEPATAQNRPTTGRVDGSQAVQPPAGGAVAPPAGAAFPAAADFAAPSRIDAPAPVPAAGGARPSARVLEMRTHFAPVVARPLDRRSDGEQTASPAPATTPETTATAETATAAATDTDIGLARPATAVPSRAPWTAPADGRTANAAATGTPAARSEAPPHLVSPPPIGPGAPRDTPVSAAAAIVAQATAPEAFGSSPANPARAAPEGPPRAGDRQAARASMATPPDLRAGPRPEPRSTDPVASRPDGRATTADDGPAAAAPEAVAPATTSSPGAGAAMDPTLRTLAEDIGRAARPLATADTAAAAAGSGPTSAMLRRDVEVELSAPEFGVVRVRMRLHGSSLELSLRTDDPATLGLLADRKAELERAIAETGVDVKVVDVSRTSAPTPAASSSSPPAQAPTSDSGRSGDGQRFEQQSSPDRNDRRSPSDRPTDGTTHDEDPTSRAGARAGTLFV